MSGADSNILGAIYLAAISDPEWKEISNYINNANISQINAIIHYIKYKKNSTINALFLIDEVELQTALLDLQKLQKQEIVNEINYYLTTPGMTIDSPNYNEQLTREQVISDLNIISELFKVFLIPKLQVILIGEKINVPTSIQLMNMILIQVIHMEILSLTVSFNK